MGEIGPQITIELAHFAHDSNQITRIKAAAPPSDAMQLKPFGLDCRTMAINASCDVHLEARIAGRARHRKPVRDEVPVLGYEIDHARSGGARFGYRRADSHRGREHVRELRDRADDVIEAGGARRLHDENIVGAQLIEPDTFGRRGEKTPQSFDGCGNLRVGTTVCEVGTNPFRLRPQARDRKDQPI